MPASMMMFMGRVEIAFAKSAQRGCPSTKDEPRCTMTRSLSNGVPSVTSDCASEIELSPSQSLMPGDVGSAIPAAAGTSPQRSKRTVGVPLAAKSKA